MPLPGPYTIQSVDGEPERDEHGNWSAFVQLTNGESALLRLKGPFPVPGDEITDRVLVEKTSKAGNTYLKLEKPAKNGSSRSEGSRNDDGPGEAYWAGQNAAKGRAHAQHMALLYAGLVDRGPSDPATLVPWIDFFYNDTLDARDKAAADGASQPAPTGASPGASTNGVVAGTPLEPTQVATSSDRSPTDKQTAFMVDLAKERGLDGAAMRAVLSTLGVQQFSQLDRKDCVDRWKDALAKFTAGVGGDIPADPWPPEPMPAAVDDEAIPF